MPVWHKATREWVKAGKLVVLGVTQEQHPDRCRLYAQWQGFEWPILHDPINVVQNMAVPIVIAIDEHGIVRSTRPRPDTFEHDFLDRTFTNDAPDSVPPIVQQQDLSVLARVAEAKDENQAWQRYGDGLVLWGGPSRINDAIAAYERAVNKHPQDADSLFRLGVCYRMRHESPSRAADDFQHAIDSWNKALALDPNQYIWRRRIQQYGPRLDKPYPFYDWVNTAIAEIKQRGETPIALAVKPYGAELAQPSRQFATDPSKQTSPDPLGKINRDSKQLIDAEVAVVPATRSSGRQFRVHVTLTPHVKYKAHWNNESEPLQVWVDAPTGCELSQRLLTAPQGSTAESKETRRVDFEIKIPSTTTGKTTLKAYALYYVCEDVDGTCLYLRQDIDITIPAPRRSDSAGRR